MSDAAQLVLDILRGTLPARVRLMRDGDVLPVEFEAGFDQLGQLDRQWAWVCERGGEITGLLLASPCHGVALVWKVAMKEGERSLLRLLRTFVRDIRQRGLKGYMTWVDPKIERQNKLRRIMEHAGGKAAIDSLTLVAAPLKGGV